MSNFFFQAEDGIRDVAVTGVQTCALPILTADSRYLQPIRVIVILFYNTAPGMPYPQVIKVHRLLALIAHIHIAVAVLGRSEERRVGKECRSGWSQYHYRQTEINRVGDISV